MAPDLVQEQLKGMYQHMASSLAAATFFGLVLAAYMARSIPQDIVLAWVVCKVLVVLPRVAVFKSIGKLVGWEWPRLAPLTIGLILLDGLVWGVGGLLFVRVGGSDGGFAAASLSFVACLATFGYQNSFKATVAYAGPILVGVLLGFMFSGEPHSWISGMAVALALSLMLKTARTSQHRFLELHRLRRLAQEISDERAQALKEAQSQSELKSRLMANVSHEIRSPLHSILGLGRELQTQTDREKNDRAAALIIRSGEHLLHLVNDLLDQSKLESGTMKVDAVPTDLHELFDELVHVFTLRAQAVNVQFEGLWQLPKPVVVLGDAERIRQILDNLVGNAIKFTPEYGRVQLIAGVGQNAGLCFSIRDSGPGISADHIERIFEPFEQVSTDSRRRRAGAGLGLSIARDLAKLMGGKIDVLSVLGDGATFRFHFDPPKAELAIQTAECLPVSPPYLDLSAPAAPRGKALVVDDDAVCAMVSRLTLERAGWQVELASNGEEAVAKITRAEQRPALVLMDCDMPGMGGLEATQAIRDNERACGAKAIHIIAVTGRSTKEERHACYRAGMDAVLNKPFAMGDLEAASREAGRPVQESLLVH